MAEVGLHAGPGGIQDRRTSPLLSSNNPFRNHLSSGPPSPALPMNPSARPISTNPFLDSTDFTSSSTMAVPVMNGQIGRPSTSKKTASESTRELFDNLSINDKTTGRQEITSQTNGAVRRPENVPPKYNRMPAPVRRSSQAEEERRRAAGSGRPRATGPLDIFADPPELSRDKTRERRPRRNSETSVREKTSKLLDPEDEKRRQERRKREEKRSGKSKTPSRRLDVIDKLDVTSIYGTGLFHHDGPFDACNPARNRKGHRAAPMQAFPTDSRNMSIGGSGPLNSKLNLDQIHGTGHEANIDYNSGAKDQEGYEMRPKNPERAMSFNPTDRVEPIHSEETIGLGTSTFLEGAPASRAAIQRRATEDEYNGNQEGGLSRKKSLAQKIRGVRPGGRITSPEPIASPTSPLRTGKNDGGNNPFFKDYDTEYDKKGAQIASAEQKMGRSRAPSSPKRAGPGLERKMTAESTDGGEESKSSGGFLNRVKSINPRRARAERKDTSG